MRFHIIISDLLKFNLVAVWYVSKSKAKHAGRTPLLIFKEVLIILQASGGFCDATHSTTHGARCLSVCLSVCHTDVLCQNADHVIKLTNLRGPDVFIESPHGGVGWKNCEQVDRDKISTELQRKLPFAQL